MKAQLVGWSIVTAVGVVVLAVVLGFQLFHRLDDANKVLKDFAPIMEEQRVRNLRPAVEQIDVIVAGLNAVISSDASSAPETDRLVALLSQRLGVPPEGVGALLRERYPRVAGLLGLYPLSTAGVREAQQMVASLSQALGMSQDQLIQALGTQFPNLAKILGALPAVAAWDSIQASGQDERLTRLDGRPVSRVPEVVAFLKEDVLPRLERNVDNFDHAKNLPPPIIYLTWILTGLGSALTVLGAVMLGFTLRQVGPAAGGSGGAAAPGR